MKFVVSFLLAFATVNGGVIPESQKVLEGPSSKTILVGPDGSKITAFAPGGKILLDENGGPILQGAPEVVASAAVAEPVPAVSTQEVEEIAPVITEVKEAKTSDAVAVEAVVVAAKSGDSGVSESAKSGDSEVTESAKSETVTDIVQEPEATTVVASEINTEVPVTEENSEKEADNLKVESAETEAPAKVEPLVSHPQIAAVKAIDAPVPILSYIHESPFFISENDGFGGQYIPGFYDDGSYHPEIFEY